MALFCSPTLVISSPLICRRTSSTTPSTSPSYTSSPVLFYHVRRTADSIGKGILIAWCPVARARMGEEEKLTRRNPLDFPIEWERPKPGRRPDIFPQFSPMKTPLPPPMPYDPPEEDEEEEEKKEEEEDPEKEEGDNPESLWFPFRW